ncbi:retrovirus-related pol polyprotein from transposon TNT 1-94 [Tanacetum coccineum]
MSSTKLCLTAVTNTLAAVTSRSSRSLLIPTKRTRDEVSDQHSYCFNVEDDPKTFDEAMKSKDVALLKEAINDEMDSIMGNNTWVLEDLPPVDLTKESLSSRFFMKDMGEANVILGIRIKYESNGIEISQSHYIEKVLKKFNYFDYTLISTPIDTSKKLMLNNGQAVSQLEYSRVIVLEGYTDASWISNTKDNSSTSGCVFLLGGAAGKEAEWLRNLILEILLWYKPITPISIHYHSVATLAKAYTQMYNGKSRHLGVKHSMIRELITNGWNQAIHGNEFGGTECTPIKSMILPDSISVAKNKVTQILEVVAFEEQSDDLKKKLAKNNEAKMVLYNALPKREYERIFMCKTAKDIWQSLLITHQESIDSGFARFNTIITSLKALDEGFSSKNYVRKFLRALHPKWRAKVTAIEESKDLSSLALDELIGNLKVHEVVMEKDSKIYRGKKERVKSISLKAKKESSDDETSTSGSDDKEYAMAIMNFKMFFRRKGKFVRQPREEKKSFRQRDYKKGKSDQKCFRCGDPNHLIGDCPKPSRNKDQKAFIGGSWSDSENDVEDKTNDETCLMAQSSNEVCLRTCLESDDWIKDSGCSKHMTSNKSLFSTYKAYDGEHVDNLAFNLLSVGQICDNKCQVLFTEEGSEIIKDGKTIGNRIRKNGLYVMKLGNKSQDKLCLATVVDNSTLWHRRLGHANMRLIQSLSSKELVRNLPKLKYDKHFCDACKIGKQAHASHKAKNIVSTKRCLELLHMDLFGPSTIKSYGGNLYTLVVVDDYSRYTWTRFLKTKNEALEKFEILSRKIQNQLGSSIIAIRTDHGREFDNEVQFGAYYDAQDITHNFSAPRTP